MCVCGVFCYKTSHSSPDGSLIIVVKQSLCTLRARGHHVLITQSPKKYRFMLIQLTYSYKIEDLADYAQSQV